MYCTNSFKIHFDEANVVDYLTNTWFFSSIFNKLAHGIPFKRNCIQIIVKQHNLKNMYYANVKNATI